MTDPIQESTDQNSVRAASGQREGLLGRPGAVVVAVLLITVAIDQATKYRFARWLGPDALTHRYPILGSWLAFDYVENTGAAFGMLAGRTWLLSAASLIIVAWFAVAYGRSLQTNSLMQVAVGLVLGGAFGNLVDRVRLGYVVDFIAVGDWPRFNVADSAITIGLALLFYSALREDTVGNTVT